MWLALVETVGLFLFWGMFATYCDTGIVAIFVLCFFLWVVLIYRFWCLQHLSHFAHIDGNIFIVDRSGQERGLIANSFRWDFIWLLQWRIFDQTFLLLYIRIF